MKLAFALVLLSVLPLAADTTPSISFGTPDILGSVPGVTQSVTLIPNGVESTTYGPLGMGPELSFLDEFTIADPGYYTLDASLSLNGNANECNPSGRCGSATADFTAQYWIAGFQQVSVEDQASGSAGEWPVFFFGSSASAVSDIQYLDAGSYYLVGLLQGTSWAGGEGWLGVDSTVTVLDPPVSTPEPRTLALLPFFLLIGLAAARTTARRR